MLTNAIDLLLKVVPPYAVWFLVGLVPLLAMGMLWGVGTVVQKVREHYFYKKMDAEHQEWLRGIEEEGEVVIEIEPTKKPRKTVKKGKSKKKSRK